MIAHDHGVTFSDSDLLVLAIVGLVLLVLFARRGGRV